MKLANARNYVALVIICAMFTLSSCKKENAGPSTVKFTTASASFAEDVGAIEVSISLNHTQSQPVTVNYTFSGTASTYLNGDYTIVSTSTITIPPGQLTGKIQLTAIDDTQIDANDVLTLTLSGTSSNAKLSTAAADLAFALTITNNDVTPSGAVQVDLVWDQGLNSDIDLVDLDLSLNYGVDLASSNQGTSLTSSENSSGFESLTLLSTDPDQDYYIAVPYFAGTGLVNFTLNLNGFGHVNDVSPVFTFTADQAPSGGNYFINFQGPFTKNGSTFTGRTFTTNHDPEMRIIRFKLGDFKKGK